MQELAEIVDLDRLSRAPAKFEVSELEHLNAKLLHAAPYTDIATRLAAMGVGGGEAFWLAVRGNCVRLKDAAIWWPIVNGPVSPIIEDRNFADVALSVLPVSPWDETTWAAWTKSVKEKTGASGKALFMPLRLALTGLEHGPELKALLPLIGYERATKRLKGEIA
jgi:glutamyl-tRNA synthetase